MGQSLAALQAEAAAMSLMTAQALPQAAASAQSMARTTAQLLEGLQRCWPTCGPRRSTGWGCRGPDLTGGADPAACRRQHIAGLPGSAVRSAAPADHDVHVYRIVQEGLTNALRHGDARRAQVRLAWVQGA
jgi:hypothetical protein